MVNNTDPLDDIFKALADPTRRAMLVALKTGDQPISTLAAPHSMTLAGASKHVGVLEAAGLVTRERQGRTHIISLRADRLREAEDWLEAMRGFWSERLDALERALSEES